MQYFVGVSVADSAEQSRIGERALECVILPRQSVLELSDRRVEHLEAPALELFKCWFTANEPQRCPAFRAGFGEDQGPIWEIEGSESELAGYLGARRYPAKSAGDHQVDDEKEVILQLDADSFSNTPDADDLLAVCAADRWID